jgi:cyclopropane-fatty-acyl-phospholipid synthase
LATQRQMDETYNYMDEVFRASFGECPDITGAFYDGDFTKTLEQAQSDKHDYILDGLGLAPGARILDVGCGWGPVLQAAERRGLRAVGITLSSKQAKACRRLGGDVHVRDWRDLDASTFGAFEGVVSVGAFEHFCSEAAYLRGEQEEIYGRFFELCGGLLAKGCRLYLQTMLWGKQMPPYERIALDAPRGSSEYILAVLRRFYPGSFPPLGESQIFRCAEPWFVVASTNNGRLDYIETMRQWGRVWKPTPRKCLAVAKTLRYAIADRDFFHKLESLRGGYNRICFEREVLDHQRIFFERR